MFTVTFKKAEFDIMKFVTSIQDNKKYSVNG